MAGILRLWARGLGAGAALFGASIALLGGASITLMAVFWGAGVLVVLAKSAVDRRLAGRSVCLEDD